MKAESEGLILYLDIDEYRRPHGSLGHTVYRKLIRNNLFLNAMSLHHPVNVHFATTRTGIPP